MVNIRPDEISSIIRQQIECDLFLGKIVSKLSF